jgi:hypothetical protein
MTIVIPGTSEPVRLRPHDLFAGSGEQVVLLPVTDNETVLDAISLIGGLSPVSSNRLWNVRPNSSGCGDQLLPGDHPRQRPDHSPDPGGRPGVCHEQPRCRIDTKKKKVRVLSPVGRAFGEILLDVTNTRAFPGNGGSSATGP